MPEDKQAQMEALARKKPKRILHNQLLIQIFLMALYSVPLTIVGVCFWFFFGVFPITIRYLVVCWVVGVIVYVSWDFRNIWLMRKHLRSIEEAEREKLGRRKEIY